MKQLNNYIAIWVPWERNRNWIYILEDKMRMNWFRNSVRQKYVVGELTFDTFTVFLLEELIMSHYKNFIIFVPMAAWKFVVVVKDGANTHLLMNCT